MPDNSHVQKMVVILGHPLTAIRTAWLIELKGQRPSSRGERQLQYSSSPRGSHIAC